MWEFLKTWLASTGMNLLTVTLRFVIIFALGLIIVRIVNKIINKLLKNSKLEKAAHSLIKTLAKTVMFVLLGLILAASVGIDVTGIVALASVLTLAISLALQNMLANVIGGFTLLYTHPFGSGDYVEIAGQSGSVHEVGMAYTKLITPDNRMVSIPNSAVVAAEIVNYTVLGTRRVEVLISASYDTAPKLVMDTMLGCLEGMPILHEPAEPCAMLKEYGESTIQYTMRYWVKGDDYWDTYFAVNEKIKSEFERCGVKMSYPHLNIHVEK